MPNISLTTLREIPYVNKAAMTQSNPNACGAYALIGAVGAFGIFPAINILSFVSIGPESIMKAGTIKQGDDYHALSLSIYGITGVLNIQDPTIPPPVAPELLNAGNVYNSPAAMLSAIIDFGVFQVKIFAQKKGFAAINKLYPGAKQRCINLVTTANVNVNAALYAKPAAKQTKIVCVNKNDGTIHWVAQGSDGYFYDPLNGKVNNTWTPRKTGDAMGNYTFSGLWIEITKI